MRRSILVQVMSLCALMALLLTGRILPVWAAPSPIALSVKPLDLSRPSTTEELKAAGQLGGELHPTHEFKSKAQQGKVNSSFGRAIEAWNRHEYGKAAALFAKHVEEFPDSPWSSEAVLHTGCYAQYHGRFSEAQQAFEWILEKNRGKMEYGAKMMLNKARLRMGVLRALQDDFEEAKAIFSELKAESPDWRHRTYAAHWIQRLSLEGSDQLAMRNCGTKALAYLLEKRGKDHEAKEVLGMVPQTLNGHSVESLSEIAARFGYDLVALRVSVREIESLALPAIVHTAGEYRGNRGHYWVLDKADHEGIEIIDPQSKDRYRQSYEEFSREWSGVALVFPDDKALPGTRLSRAEMAPLFGGCCGNPRPESNLGNPDEEQKCSLGSPKWAVNMINMNLFVTDTPLWHTSPIGPPVQITLSYNAQSATAYHEPFGNKWQFNYGSYLVVDPSGTVTIFMPDGKRDVYRPDGAGGYTRPYQVFNDLTRIAENDFELRFPDDTVYAYRIPSGTISLQPFLVEIRDPHGLSLQFGYDASIRLTSITDATGRASTVSYNSAGLVERVTDPFGRSALFEYDSARNLTRVTDMGGYWAKFTYDANIYLTSLENARGKWQFTFEPADGLSPNGCDQYYPKPGCNMWENYRITVANPLGGKEEYYYNGYDPARKSWYISPRDYRGWPDNGYGTPKTLYSLTMSPGKGEISAISYPGGNSISYGYDANGNRTSSTHNHPASHTTTRTYNSLGRVTSLTDPKLKRTDFVYDLQNGVDLVEQTNGLGTIHLSYNDSHDVASITNRIGHTTTYLRNSYGQIDTIIDPRNIPTSYIYNSSHQLETIERDGRILSSLTYDTVGRVRSSTDATGLTLTFDYDNLNHITKITYPDGKYETYTYAGCCPRLLETATDRSGRTTHYYHDELERLKEVIDPAGHVTKTLYDKNGNLAWLIDPKGNPTSFTYDLNDRLVKKSYANGKAISFAYDEAGLLTSRTNARGITTTYAYDENDQLRTIIYSDGTPQVTYDYDDHNRLAVSHDGTGQCIYGYDIASRLTAVDGPLTDDTISFRYDELGQTGLKTGLDIQGGRSVSYTYDTLNRLQAIQMEPQLYSYGYSQASPIAGSLTRPNGSTTTYQYDTLNHLREVSNLNSLGEIINKFGYTYNEENLRSSESRTNGVPGISFTNSFSTYDHNELNQLLSASDPERLFLYDDDGNMVQGYTPQGYAFIASYDAENRLASLEYTDNASVVHRTEYSYTGSGVLAGVKRYENGAIVDETRYVRDGFLPLQERDSSNGVINKYTWGIDIGGGIGGLINLHQGGQDYSYLFDGRGNVSALLDGSQTVVAAYTYDAFGNLLARSGGLEQPYRFSTKEYDEKTGLSYYGYRFYSPALGRWTTRDPLEEAGGINLYGFVQNDPVNLIDPFGLDPLADFERADAIGDMLRNYLDMRWANNKNQDKYFHCKANCEAASRGEVGLQTAMMISELREIRDELLKGDAPEACNEDRAANEQGRNGRDSNDSCKKVCERYRPNGLPQWY